MLTANDELRDQLLAEKILPAEQVEKLAQHAAAQGIEFEVALRKSRLMTDTQLQALRGMRLGVPFCNLPDYIPRLQNADLLPEDLARRHVMFPLFDLEDTITLVIEDPNDLTAIDHVRRLRKKEVEVCTSSRSDILGLLERAYGSSNYLRQSSLADSLKDAATDLEGLATQPVIKLVDDLINEAIRQGASDIHIEPGEHEMRMRIRVDGVLREIASPPLGLHRALVSRIKIIARLNISQTRAPQDGAFHHQSGEADVIVRVSILPSIFGEAVVMRLLRNESESISLRELGMSQKTLDRFQRVVSSPHGMILVSGPTGSGKSTTLYAALKFVATPQKNIIAIEDPVEYRNSAIRQIQVNPEVDLTFATGLRSVLRQDPDVIMVGEIRDAQTAQIAIQASLTGHLVLSTVHTNDSISAVVRFRDLGIPEYLISSSFLAVLAQRLCRRICPDCRAPDSPSPFLLEAIGLTGNKLDFEPMRGKGCRRCVGSGYVGRVGIYELFELDDEFRSMIVRCESSEAIAKAAAAKHMDFLQDDGID